MHARAARPGTAPQGLGCVGQWTYYGQFLGNQKKRRAVRWFTFPVVSYHSLTACYAAPRAVAPDGRYIVGHDHNVETGRAVAFLLDTLMATRVAEEELPAGSVRKGSALNPFTTITAIRLAVRPTHVWL